MTGLGLRSAVAIILCLFVSACDDSIQVTAPVTAGGPKGPLTFTADQKRRLLDGGLAEEITRECPQHYTINPSEKAAVEHELQTVAGAQGYRSVTHDTLIASIGGQRVLQDTILGYIAKRNILIGDSASFCAAGDAEVAGHTAIGKYLVAH